MSVVDTKSWSTQHWIFKHYNDMQNTESLSTNYWLESNFHDLPLEYGDVEHKEIDRILSSLKFMYTYVKREQSQRVIEQIIPHITIINIEDIGCTKWDRLLYADKEFPRCTYHMDFNPKYCTFYKVFALKNWFTNNMI